jgi:hypothetical protein
MEVVRLGDVNVDAYTTAMDSIKALVPRLKKVAVEGDGLGLEHRLGAKKARVDGAAAKGTCWEAELGSVDGAALSFDAGILAPSKNRSGGRPTTSRDKPPYETTSKRTRFCTICRLPGHKSATPTGCVEGSQRSKMLQLWTHRSSEDKLRQKKGGCGGGCL